MYWDDDSLPLLMGFLLLMSPFLGFFAYWVFLLMKLGWFIAETMGEKIMNRFSWLVN